MRSVCVPQVLARDLVLRDATLRGELREQGREEAGVGQEPQTRPTADAARSSRSSSAAIRSPDRWAVSGACARIAARVAGSMLEAERGREPDRAQTSAARPPRTARPGRRRRGSDRAPMSATPSYGSTSRRLGGAARRPAPRDGVDREVAPGEVDLDGVAELDPVRPSEVGVVVVLAERRDLAAVRPGRRRARATVPNAFS